MQALSWDRSRRTSLWLALGLLALAAPLRAAAPRDELLRLVPDSIGFCLVVHDLRTHAAAWRSSPLVEQLRQSPLAGKVRNSAEMKKLGRLEAHLKDKLGLDWAQLRDDILGDALVFVYRPGPPGKPEREEGLILVRARNAKILAELIERLNQVQKEEGSLKELEERRHNGAVYHRRLERNKPATFYYVNGPVVALSEQEDMLRQAIDCDRLRSAEVVPDVTRRLRELEADRALLAVWINPRAFDAEVESKAAGVPAERAATVRHFAGTGRRWTVSSCRCRQRSATSTCPWASALGSRSCRRRRSDCSAKHRRRASCGGASPRRPCSPPAAGSTAPPCSTC